MTGLDFCSVVEDDAVTIAVNEATARYARAEEVYFAALWRIARERECGTVLLETDPERRLLHLLPIELAQSPGLLVRYYCEQFQVVVDWVQFYDFDSAKASIPKAFVA